GAAGKHRLRAIAIDVHDELVVADVALPEHAVGQVNLQIMERLAGFLVRAVAVATALLCVLAGVREDNLDARLSKGLQVVDELLIGQLVEGTVTLPPFLLGALEQHQDTTVEVTYESGADRVFWVFDALLEHARGRETAPALRQATGDCLGRDDAPVEEDRA